MSPAQPDGARGRVEAPLSLLLHCALLLPQAAHREFLKLTLNRFFGGTSIGGAVVR
jgi:hypothetical protein